MYRGADDDVFGQTKPNSRIKTKASEAHRSGTSALHELLHQRAERPILQCHDCNRIGMGAQFHWQCLQLKRPMAHSAPGQILNSEIICASWAVWPQSLDNARSRAGSGPDCRAMELTGRTAASVRCRLGKSYFELFAGPE